MNEQLSKPEPALKKGKNPSHCPALLPAILHSVLWGLTGTTCITAVMTFWI